MLSPDILIESVSFEFGTGPLFQNLNFNVRGGEWTCLLGPSGSGKSTLLRLIAGSLRKGMQGSIRYGQKSNPSGMSAWMAQKDLLLPWLTVEENVLLGARLRGSLTKAKREKARVFLSMVGLGDVSHYLPAALSGGMRQRVALLRTLMEERSVILMDEPFSALDALNRLKLQNLSADLVEGATVLLVTHDPLEALRLGHQIHVMTGRPAAIGPALIPPGKPPRNPGDPVIAALHAKLLDRLVESDGE
jgi:putative hydroxymethylpyrimidine transport system ATP-binding protein